MSEATMLLERISTFRQRLQERRAAVAASTAAEPATVLTADASPGTAKAQRLSNALNALLQRQLQLQQESFAQNPDDPLGKFHQSTQGLLKAVQRLLGMLPPSAEEQLSICAGIEQMIVQIDRRQDSLRQALNTRTAQQQRLARLSNFLANLHEGKPLRLNPLVDLAGEILEESRHSARLNLLNPLEAAGPNQSVLLLTAAHALNAAAIAARLLPLDFEWAAKPILPILAVLTMDVGMLSVPSSILFSNQALSLADRRVVEQHARIGADLLRGRLPDSGPLADIVLAHHERPDGTGYPNGVRGGLIPTLSRLIAVADTYAALREPRPQREAYDSRAALAEVLLLAEQGKLDRDFAEYLLTLSFHPVGTVVELADGRLAVVAATLSRRIDDRTAGRPIVAVLTDADGRVRPKPDLLDLSTSAGGGIVCSVPKQEYTVRLIDWYPELCV